jgi:hypothetical protein
MSMVRIISQMRSGDFLLLVLQFFVEVEIIIQSPGRNDQRFISINPINSFWNMSVTDHK